ncbi:MAG: phenylalanine--tRNA ligase subunit beta, partial [Bacteroidia bacterium]
NTDASFRFERGIDPDSTLFALKRATLLLQEIAGATVSSEITDIYPKPILGAEVSLSIKQVQRLTGIAIAKEKIVQILEALDIEISADKDDVLDLKVPAYRVDVTREADVIEEILRIYGYSNIPVKTEVKSVLSYAHKPDTYKLKNVIGDYLSANGFNEIMNNSLTKTSYYENSEIFAENEGVILENPLSQDLGTMRRSLLFGGLESVAYNTNRKRSDLRFYEFGKTYHYKHDETAEHPVKNYSEFDKLGIFLTGNREEKSWNMQGQPTDFYHLKTFVFNVLEKLGINRESVAETYVSNEMFAEGLEISLGKQVLGTMGQITKKYLQKVAVNQSVFYAELN